MTPPAAILDQYPSTSDYQTTKKVVDDPVLLILKNARERYRVGAVNNNYVDEDGIHVCAIGAVGAEVGVDYRDFSLFVDHLDAEKDSAEKIKFAFKYYLEEEMKISEAAKEAISLLDKSALFLYGNMEYQLAYAWALEWVNQRFDWSTGEAKEAVLQCYDHAILERERSVIA